MKIGNIDVDFSFTDADDIEKFEKALAVVKEKSAEYQRKQLKMSEALRLECDIIDEFFDTTFGEGISQKLFNGKKDLQKHMELFKDITDAKNETTRSFQNLYDNLEIRTKYMPNRETRRYNKYKGRK